MVSFLDLLTTPTGAVPSFGALLGAGPTGAGSPAYGDLFPGGPVGTPAFGDLFPGGTAGAASYGATFGLSPGAGAGSPVVGLGAFLPDPAPFAQPSIAAGLAQTRAAQQAAADASKPKTPTSGTGTPTNTVAPPADPQAAAYYGFANAHMPYAMQAVQQAGADLDPAIAVAVAANETGWGGAPNSGVPYNSFHGIRGSGSAGSTPGGFRANLTPQESYQDFVNLVTTSPTYAAAYQTYQQTHDPNQFIRDIANAGYASNTTVEANGRTEAQNWTQQVQNLIPQVQQWWQSGPPAGSVTPASGRVQGVSAPNMPLPPGAAAAFCGPLAATAFANANGRNPTAIEAMNLAKNVGWNQQQGMAGPASEVQLLNDMGVPAYMEPVNWQKVAEQAAAGRGAIINTPGHYYQVVDANPQTGDLLLGDAVGRGRWVQPQAIAGLGYGAPDYAIYQR